MRRLRSRAFIVGLLLGGIGIALVTRLPALIMAMQGSESHSLAISGPPAIVSQARTLLSRDGGYDMRVVSIGRAPDEASLRRWHVGAALVVSQRGNGLGVTAYAADPANVDISGIRGRLLPLELALRTNRSPAEMAREVSFPIAVRSVTARFSNAAASIAAHGVAYLLLMLLYMLIIFNSQLVLTSVAEEKTSRVAEILVSSVDLTTLLVAKIVASTLLAALQMATWIVIGGALSFGSGPDLGRFSASAASSHIGGIEAGIFAALSPATIAGFVIFFVLGFLAMSVIFAGAGSLVNRTEDLGSVSGPLFLPVIVAFLVAIVGLTSPHAPFVVACSFVPILSPLVMFARIAVSNVPPLQIAAAGIIDVATIVLFAMAGGRLYRVGMLLYGRTPSWPQIVRALVAR